MKSTDVGVGAGRREASVVVLLVNDHDIEIDTILMTMTLKRHNNHDFRCLMTINDIGGTQTLPLQERQLLFTIRTVDWQMI